MHEVVFSDALQKKNGVSTMDIAKRLIDYGFHPYTTAFPLIVAGGVMIETTGSGSKEERDPLLYVVKTNPGGSATQPGNLKNAPPTTPAPRPHEVGGAPKPGF